MKKKNLRIKTLQELYRKNPQTAEKAREEFIKEYKLEKVPVTHSPSVEYLEVKEPGLLLLYLDLLLQNTPEEYRLVAAMFKTAEINEKLAETLTIEGLPPLKAGDAISSFYAKYAIENKRDLNFAYPRMLRSPVFYHTHKDDDPNILIKPVELSQMVLFNPKLKYKCYITYHYEHPMMTPFFNLLWNYNDPVDDDDNTP